MKSWKKYLLYAAYLLIASGLLYGLLQLILAGYSVSWTGFGERTLSNGDIVGEKTLWDWMELLIIPLVLALGACFLDQSERNVERAIRASSGRRTAHPSESKQITAELMYISKHAHFWQDVDSAATNAAGEVPTAKDWAAAGDSFDTSYERVRAVFGSEETPGLDEDSRLFVIHSENIGKVGGYFSQADQFPAVVDARSNEGQYFFISNTYSSGIASDYYKEVLAT